MSSVGFYTVKITAIFLLSVLYFVVGGALSLLLNETLPEENLHEWSTVQLMIHLSLVFGVIGVVFYVLRNLIKRMPFPLEGYYGFRYGLLREVTGGIIVAYVMYAYLDRLQAMMKELALRFRKPSD
jgi:H+/Cl- antiporter ClcA